jgi:predicted O-methyltransferase YrrM
LKHYLKYAYNSKSKFKIHSPFVFTFIINVLENRKKDYMHFPKQLLSHYKALKIKVSVSGNAGEGSKSLSKKQIPAIRFIGKVGLPAKYGKVLNGLIEENKIEHVIELGTSLGRSTSFLVSGNRVKVTTVEANKEMLDISKEAFNHLGQSGFVTFVHARFDEVFGELCKNDLSNTLIFIDGDHGKDAVLNLFKTCLPYTKPSTILVFDDIYWSPGMTEAWCDIEQHDEVKLSLDIYRMGIVFFRKATKAKEHFQLWY